MSIPSRRKTFTIRQWFIRLMISISVLQCSAMRIAEVEKQPKEQTSGESRSVLDLANLIPGLNIIASNLLGYNRPYIENEPPRNPPLYPAITPSLNGSSNDVIKVVNITNVDHNKVEANQTNIAPTDNNLAVTPSLDELEKALLEPGVECGKVPLFESLYKRSINESFDSNPGAESEGDVRILHGLDSLVGEWPWIVRIKKCDKDDQNCKMCTGTLLNSRWVITAGHCQLPNVAVNEYKATIGLYDLLTPDEKSFDVAIDKLFRHPDYYDLTNDLLLMRLAKPVEFNDQVQPACLVHRTRNIHVFTKHRKCYTVGYGLTSGMVDAIKLQKLQITTRDPTECNRDQLGSVRLKRGTVCVGPPDGKEGGSCKGDSGGPDLCYDPKGNRWVIFGTVSYGPSICDREEGEKWLTVSTDLSNFRTWILSTVHHNK